MNVNEEIPQWAYDRVDEIAGDKRTVWVLELREHFARYIAQHEQPPVDPDLVKAREICARVFENSGCGIAAGNCRSGKLDDYSEVQFALSALKEARNA